MLTSSSYDLTSSTYDVAPAKDSPEIHGSCGDGYHVDATYGGDVGSTSKLQSDVESSAEWHPKVTAHGKWISIVDARGLDKTGTDAKGQALYQGLSLKLYNSSLISHHDGSFTWTCDAN